jgi:c-di-GMP-binding flagellar brake protein YcgR
MQQDESRRSPRVNRLLLTAYVNRDGKEQKTPVSLGRTLDISLTGVGMEVFQEIKIGTVMDLDLDLKDCILTVHGKVVHVRREEDDRYVVGIEFDEILEQPEFVGEGDEPQG